MRSKFLLLFAILFSLAAFLFWSDVRERVEACVWGPNPTCNLYPDDYCMCTVRLDIYKCIEETCTFYPDYQHVQECTPSCTFYVGAPSEKCYWDYVGDDRVCRKDVINTHSGYCCVNIPPGEEPPPTPPPGEEPPGGGEPPPPPQCSNDCSCSNYSCPAGTSTENTGPFCSTSQESCQCTTECGYEKTNYGPNMCYEPEENQLTPNSPSHVGLKIAGYEIPLTTTSTLIPRPLEENAVGEAETAEVYVPSYQGDTTGARAVKHYMCVNNIGDGGWTNPDNPWLSGGSPHGEDFCANAPCDDTPLGLSPVRDFVPNTMSMYDTLDHGFEGSVMGETRFVDMCDNTCNYSSTEHGFTTGRYIVNTYPEPVSVTNITATSEREEFLGCTADYSSTRIHDEVKYEVLVEDVDGPWTMETIGVWFSRGGQPPPTVRDLQVDGDPPKQQVPSRFGFMVEKARGADAWTWVFVSNFTGTPGKPFTWWRNADYKIANTLDTDLVRIPGSNPDKTLAVIKDVSVVQMGGSNNMRLRFSIQFLHPGNAVDLGFDLSEIETVPSGQYSIFVSGGDKFGFKADQILTHRVVPKWSQAMSTWGIDFKPPTMDMDGEPEIHGSQEFSIKWNSTDEETAPNLDSGLKRVFGDAELDGEPDITDRRMVRMSPHSGVYTFSPITPLFGEGSVDSSHLWVDNTPHDGDEGSQERFNIQSIDQGSIRIFGAAMDNACNFTHCADPGGFGNMGGSDSEEYLGRANCVDIDLEDTWITTRGGQVYSEAGFEVEMRDIVSQNPKPLTNQNDGEFFANPFRFQITNDADDKDYDLRLSSSLLLLGSNVNPGITSNDRKFVRSSYDLTQPTMYQFLLERYEDMKHKGRITVHEFQYAVDSSVTGTLSDPQLMEWGQIDDPMTDGGGDMQVSQLPPGPPPPPGSPCNENHDFCVIRPTPNLVVNQSFELFPNFECNKAGVIFVPGDLIAHPNLTKGEDPFDGCIFVVQGTVFITPGEEREELPADIDCSDINNPNCYPMYDLLEGLFIADGGIVIQDDNVDSLDGNQIANDGLKIHGGLIGINSVPPQHGSGAIVNNRNLRLHFNLLYPTLAIHNDPRYVHLVRELFGRDRSHYRVEIGLKAL